MRSPPELALTRLATRGDLSQLRWARWQSARSFDAHPINAHGGGGPHLPLPNLPTMLRCRQSWQAPHAHHTGVHQARYLATRPRITSKNRERSFSVMGPRWPLPTAR